jgi:predicted acyltransferase
VAGYYTGIFIQQKGKSYEVISKLMLTGSLLIFLALWWNMIFPINKKIWTPPYVLLTSGIDLLLIASLVYIIEMRDQSQAGWTKFFLVFGKNPLLIYLLSELLVTILYMIPVGHRQSLYGWINKVFFQVIAPGAIGSFLFAITYMLLCWAVGWWLNKRRIYVKV